MGSEIAVAGVIAVVVVAVLVVVGIAFLIFKRWIQVARADEALVISGRKQADGEVMSNVTVIVNGRAVVNPITQRAQTISLRSRQVSMTAEAQSEDNITLSVEAVALVKIGSNPELARRAAERFASQDGAIVDFTTEQLEGALRGVVAQLSVADLMRDRKKFSEQIATDVATDLSEQGLILDSFQIKGITDNVGYIQSLGVPQIQEKRQAAEVAETNADREILKRRLATDEENLIEETQLAQNREASNAKVGRAQAQAEQAKAFAQAEAEKQVLIQEAENKQSRLDAEVRKVADADRYRREQEAEAKAFERVQEAKAAREVATEQATATRLRAEADAEAIRLEGQAKADAIRAEAEALKENQEALLAQKALEIMPQFAAEFARGYSGIDSITIIGGDDSSGAAYTAGEFSKLSKAMEDATGLNLTQLIQAGVTGNAAGRAAGAQMQGASQRDLPTTPDADASQDS
ncbi:flotillin family protein [Kocuria sp.]|uniref:flotillin family protein n=1 Tax=Kocuria sp. TaxID=1871328 RepID=UPI0026DFE016|nr:SPFH domain-containing protein [Kocuria sp.]MDO5617961.1 SPFH domain-containing protein [Kocuria sp.]